MLIKIVLFSLCSLRAFGGTVDSPAGKRSKGKKRRPVIEDDEDDDFGIAAPDQEEDDSEEVISRTSRWTV